MERNREITVKGVGTYHVPVDFVTVTFTLDELNKDYQKGRADPVRHDHGDVMELLLHLFRQARKLRIEIIF